MMTAPYYKGGKSMMASLIIMKIKFVCSKKMSLVGHVLNHMLDYMLNYILDPMLDHIIIGLVTTVLYIFK